MLHLAAVFSLLALGMCIDHSSNSKEGEHKQDAHNPEMWGKKWRTFLMDEGLSQEDIEKWVKYFQIQADQTNEEVMDDITWEEALGYVECDEFKHHHDYHHDHHHGDHSDKRDHELHGHDGHHGDDGHHGHDRHHGHHDDDGHHGHDDDDGHHEHDEHHEEQESHSDESGKEGKGKHFDNFKPQPIDAICGKESECPEFEEIDSGNCGYGTRRITGGKWAEAKIDVSDVDGWITKSFFKLFRYINGHNDQQVKVDMTAPVLSLWCFGADYDLTSAAMYFYIPQKHQDSPPLPMDTEHVTIVEWSDIDIYHRAFGGRSPGEEVYEKQFENLHKALADAGEAVQDGVYITGGFTNPTHGRQRYEVMLLAAEE